MSDSVSQSAKPRGPLALVGAVAILISGVIHLIMAPEHFEEATYLGWLFLLQTAGAVVAAIGVYLGQRWAWALGILVAGGAFVLYFVEDLVGFPGIEPEGVEALLEPPGVLAKIVEFLFLVLAVVALARGGGRAT